MTTPRARYDVLDGFRGIAALMVLSYHFFEAFAASVMDQRVNHGYLAVDFFFLLSGFVISYAYDRREETIGRWGFLLRRLIRLQPLVVVTALLGAALFYLQDYSGWEVEQVSVGALLASLGMHMLLIPAAPGVEIRGLGEMFPLNGPMWSLFYEYIGYLCYAFFLRRLSLKRLKGWVLLTGLGLAAFALFGPMSSIGYGWQLTGVQVLGGSLRMLFSFSMGILLRRTGEESPREVKGAFGIGTLVLVAAMLLPRVGGEAKLWGNGLYEILCVAFVFPMVIRLGAAARPAKDSALERGCRLLGELSYPLYLVHYPVLYIYFAHVWDQGLAVEQTIPLIAGIVVVVLLLALVISRCIDRPVRRWLRARFLAEC